MGKSPGKWIKGILFGKKTSKFDIPKGRVLSKSASERPARSSSSKELVTALLPDEPIISGPVSDTIANESSNSTRVERKETVNGEKVDQDRDLLNIPDRDLSENQLQQAVITLQAAVRGNLVRRQAVATLSCIQGIIKFQALARGYMVRNKYDTETAQFRGKSYVAQYDAKISDTCEITKHVQASRLLKNGFIQKLCCSSTSVMPLRLEYDQGEPNSSWNWLIRWSTLQVWAPDSEPRQIFKSKHEAVETEISKNDRNDPNRDDPEKQNFKLNTKEPCTLSSEPAQENNEISGKNDKVKHDREVVKPAHQVSNEAETDVVKPRSLQRKKLSKSSTHKLSDKKSNVVMDKPAEDTPEKDGVKSGVTHLSSEEGNLDLFTDKSFNDFTVKKESTDDQSSTMSQKSNRRASLPAKHDNDQYTTTPESVKKLPSYMAKTASSKAKVKAQVSPRLGLDRNSLDRRLSLPSSVNGKMSSSSPRVQKLVQGKAIQVDWKR